jgi:hypothetical protein
MRTGKLVRSERLLRPFFVLVAGGKVNEKRAFSMTKDDIR